MRIRVVKPEYWRDPLLASLSANVREFYIGLWMIADDAGWLKWDPREVAAELYPYRGVSARERAAVAHFQVLTEASRVVLHPCGHAVIPTFQDHQRTTGGRQTFRFRDSHRNCGSVPVRTDPYQYGRKGKGKEGKEGKEGTPHIRLVGGQYEVV